MIHADRAAMLTADPNRGIEPQWFALDYAAVRGDSRGGRCSGQPRKVPLRGEEGLGY